ncbi:PREDICTED: pleckstrin homology domain-containing family M member 2 isoform X1 [Myotis brandtii]|uniref:pleckstrin homology domain-containing family M member 2 isoform X1 n=1 Tax=Myotis brandtii TaxID=109478 RepID=UPI000703E23C|nr:PREDICTED: pleckstrin homology domain-containing family M member 2 isoform X1 [Myotis brandtii]
MEEAQHWAAEWSASPHRRLCSPMSPSLQPCVQTLPSLGRGFPSCSVNLQSYFAACEDETPAIRNHDKVLQRLCEHLDHALLYGLQDLSSGYWVLVVHFTRREAIKQIEVLQHVATNLGRSRAWLYLALNENSLESYLRLFQENLGLLHKYYVKNALVCSHDHLTLFLTLVSGLEFIRFDLDLDAPYLDLAPYMPDYYKPQHLLDFEDRLPSSAHGSDSLSLNSFNSVTSTNLEWDDSAIAPSSEDYDFGDVFPAVPSVPSTDWEDGDLTDTVSGPRSTASDLTSSKASTKSPTQRHNPFNEEQAEAVSSSDTTPVHTASQGKEPHPPELLDAGTELEVIRVTKKKKTGKKKKTRSDEEASPLRPASAQHTGARRGDGDSRVSSPGLGRGSPDTTLASPQEKGEGPSSAAESSERSEPSQMGLLIPEMKDTSMERVGQPLSKVIDQLNGQLDPRTWCSHGEPPDQPFRTGSPGDTPERPPFCDFSEGLPAPMDFYRFTVESPSTVTSGGGHHDPAGPSQPLHVPGGPAAAGQEEEGGGGGEGQAPPPLGATLGEAQEPETRAPETQVPPVKEGPGPEPESGTQEALCQLKRDQPSPCLSSAEDSGVEEGQGSPSEMSHSAEFRVDNNHLLLLMIHVFRENEEQLFKMIRMSTGHMEGTLQLLYVLLTDCYVYLLRKGATEKPYLVEEAVSYNELDYVSVGLDQQAVRLVCTNRRKQFLLDTADAALAEFFLASLKSAMIKGCREPPYPSILTDATMEKLALAKFVAQESKCEVRSWGGGGRGRCTGRTPLTSPWAPSPATAHPPRAPSPRRACCITRRAPPTWARSSGRPASWCSATGSSTSTPTAPMSSPCSR